jgi:hypothetical protein
MKILGLDYTVRRTQKVEDSQYFGRHNPETMVVSIALCATRQMEITTMLHELIEAINWRSELKMDHLQITSLEVGLFTTLIDAGVDLEPIHPDHHIPQ